MNRYLVFFRAFFIACTFLVLLAGLSGAVGLLLPASSSPNSRVPVPVTGAARPNTAIQSLPGSYYDWLQFNSDPQHSGNEPAEVWIGPGNVSQLSQLFQVSLPATVDGAPVLLHNVATPSGVKSLIFATTTDGRILALDAQSGVLVWSKQYGPGSCTINNGTAPCYTTSSPAIDPGKAYVYSYGLDGYVHKYQVGDGVEVKTGGWPELVTLKGFNEKGSSALSTATFSNGASYLYAASAGYPGDQGDYQGHITAINLANGSQQVFNMVCSNQAVHFVQQPGSPDCPDVQTAVWARDGVVTDPATGKIYLATGNGSYDPAKHAWGDSVLALQPDGSGANGDPLDSYTPSNFQTLQNTDADLGSTAPAILPALPVSKVQHLGVQGGKDGLLRLLNLDNLSGQGGIGHIGGEIGPAINLPGSCGVLTQPEVWTNPADGSAWVFVSCGTSLSGYTALVDASGNPSLRLQWTSGVGGTSPIVANGVLFYASSSGIRAVIPVNGNLLWSDPGVSSFHWQSPIVANGVLYITDQSSRLTAYSIKGQIPAAFTHFEYLPAVNNQ